MRRRCWLLPSTLWGLWRLGQGRLEKAGLPLPPSRSLALLGFSAAYRPRKLESLSKHREFSTASDGSGSRLCNAKDEDFFFFFKGNELNFYPALVQGLECKHPVIATHPSSAGISQESRLSAASAASCFLIRTYSTGTGSLIRKETSSGDRGAVQGTDP